MKVLDFGLAKAMAAEAQANETYDSQSPTLSAMPTRAGVILGTAAYMSPEQARGKKVDKRTDIWAFGCVLFELLTGRQAFQSRDREGADTVQDIIARILQGEPDWQALPGTTPEKVRDLLRRCLQKDVTRRSRDAAEIRLQIEEALAAPATGGVVIGTRTGWRRMLLPVLGSTVLAAIITGIAVWQLRPAPPPSFVTHTVIPLREDNQLGGNFFPMLALSPDGTQLAYIAGSGTAQQIYVRAMDAIEARVLAGTERAQDPFFSPDGEWIAFFADGKLKKVSVSGGAVLTLCDVPSSRGGSWGVDDTIVFAPTNRGGLWEVPAAGGEPQELTKLNEGELSHRWPQLLPDGKTLIFTVATRADAVNPAASNEIAALNLDTGDTGEHKVVIRGGTFGRYVPTGHLVYYSAGTIMAAPFDPGRLEAGGAPAPVVEDVMSSTEGTGAGQFSFSNLGSLVYVAGGNQQAASSLVWVDRGGTEEPVNAPPRQYLRPRLSPDGQRLAVEIVGQKTDIWIYDLSQETLTPITFEGDKIQVAWTPDAKRIVYSSAGQADGTRRLYWKPADGTGSEELLTSNQYGFNAPSMTPDGKWLAWHVINPETSRDIWGLPLEGERKPRPLLQEPFNESAAAFSPDGRWLAYASDESGQSEVYVRSFPGLEGKWRISTEGGGGPYWNPNGRELFYRSGNKMMAVDVTTQPTFTPGRPTMVFEGQYNPDPTGQRPNYDVSPDGQRFLMMKRAEQQTDALTQINVVLNWFEELKQKVPAN
ncbi:MAG: PD40 domain-containing protein [Acidobacteria bacterium]|nr:PD40 domain-containing protein [Acidobacteriota bacterium]